MANAVRRALRIGLATLLLGGLTASPVLAADDSSADAKYYRSSVTQIQPAVPGLDVKVQSGDGQITLTNHTGKTVTVVGLAGEDYLRVTPNGAEENTASLTASINASAAGDKTALEKATAAAHKAPTWVKRGAQPTITWRDYRVRWTNKQRPPIVLNDPHSKHTVFSWAVNLKVGSQPVLVLGEVTWIGTPWLTTTQLALIGIALLSVVLVGSWAFFRRRNRTRRMSGRGGRQSGGHHEQWQAPVPSMRGY
jgi:hypothetical protein